MLIREPEISKWLPGFIRAHVISRQARRVLLSLQGWTEKVVGRAIQHQGLCVTKYARNRLRFYVKDIPEKLLRLEKCIARSEIKQRGIGPAEKLARNIQDSLKITERILEEDSLDAEKFQQIMEDKEKLTSRAATLLVGAASLEFKGHLTKLQGLDLSACRDRKEIAECFRKTRKELSDMERVVEGAEKVRESLPLCEEALSKLDRAILASDPRENEQYLEITQILEEVKEVRTRGENHRAKVLLDRAQQRLHKLEFFISTAGMYAADEIQLWRGVATMCPTVCAPFAERLMALPSQPVGEELQSWTELKREIENIVRRKAEETREANAQVLGKRPHRVRLFRDDEGIFNFASRAARDLRHSVAG